MQEHPVLRRAPGDHPPTPGAAAGPPRRLTLADTVRLIRRDLAFQCRARFAAGNWRLALRLLLLHPGAACVLRYRLQCWLCSNRLAPLGRALRFVNLALYGIDLDEGASIGGGFRIAHAVTIRITAGTVIGERCTVFHQTMIGRSPYCEPGREPGPVLIGDDVVFGPGACVYGRIVIGDGCRIGVNTVVDRSFPAATILSGVPARVVGGSAARP